MANISAAAAAIKAETQVKLASAVKSMAGFGPTENQCWTEDFVEAISKMAQEDLVKCIRLLKMLNEQAAAVRRFAELPRVPNTDTPVIHQPEIAKQYQLIDSAVA